MHLASALTCLTAFSSFSWGAVRFFTKPSGLTRRAGATASLGVFFAGWHVYAIATAATSPWRAALGMIAHALAAAIFWTAVRACQSQPLTAIFEDDLPVRLVRRGPYAYVRHPFYTAYTIFWLGGWVASDSLVTLLSVAAMLAIYVRGAMEEERKFSRSALAREYAAYRTRVRAWRPAVLVRDAATDR